MDTLSRIEEYEALMDGPFAPLAADALRANKATFKKAQLARANRVLGRHGQLFEPGS